MSEAEKKKRREYKRIRQRRMSVQICIMVIVAVIIITCAFTSFQLSKNIYANYTEKGIVDYSVYLKGNEFYERPSLGANHTYVGELVDEISAYFKYDLNMDTSDVNYTYSYSVIATLEIVDKTSGEAIYAPEFVLVEKQTLDSQRTHQVMIRERLVIDYDQYNYLSNEFLQAYELTDVTSNLVVRMNVNVMGSSKNFDSISNSSVVALNIPLSTKTVDIKVTSNVTSAENKVLSRNDGIAKDIFKFAAIVFSIAELSLIVIFIIYVILTRNEDITYTNRIRKILSRYKPYIQQLIYEFDTEGYQLVYIKTFEEMLEIRDTVEKPILMYENDDRTCSTFVIPSNTKVLYYHQVKAEDFDVIYNIPEPVVEEPVVEEPVVEEPVVEEPVSEEIAEALAQPEVAIEEIDFVDDIVEDEVGIPVIGVVWPERAHKNKIYRYDPDGEELEVGDIVLVPSRDVASKKDIIRKATVAHGNYLLDPTTLKFPLKKIIQVVKKNH